jgi:hypothetical protein
MKNLTGSLMGLAGLWALAVAQPVLDALKRAPEFFVAHRADTIDAIVVAGALTLSGAIVCAAILAVAWTLNRRLVEPAAAFLVGAMTAILAVQIAYRTGMTGWPAALAVVAGVGGLGALAWLRMTVFRTYLGVLSPAALIVPLVFVLGGPWRSGAGEPSGEPGAASSPGTIPVVIMVFDELSLVSLLDDAGQLNAVRFPNLAALAADGVWFRNATAVSDVTQSALPAILTGRYPAPRANPTIADHPNTVFSLVGRDYRFETFEAATSLCPLELCSDTGPPRRDRLAAMAADIAVVAGHTFLPPASRGSLPDVTQNWAGFAAVDDAEDNAADDDTSNQTGPRVIRARRSWRTRWHSANRADHLDALESFAAGISPDDRQPTLYFIHTLATHQPARWLPSGQLISDRVGIPGQANGRWSNVEWLVAQHHHSDIMQAMLADTLLGKVRGRLADAGIYDSALVIVTADHGISFIPGRTPRRFSRSNATEILSVPLIVKAPARMPGVARGTIDDTNAETIDVLPTVAHVLGIQPTWRVDGRSLIGDEPPRAQKQFFINGATRRETYGPDQLRPIRDRLAKRQAETFGLDRWPVFGVPGLLALAGRRVESFGKIQEIASVRVVVERRDALLNVNLNSRSLPAQLTGRFDATDAGDAADIVLAVALNGTVVATTRAWPRSQRWMAMLPPDGLRSGKNDVEVFVVEPSGGLLRPRQ